MGFLLNTRTGDLLPGIIANYKKVVNTPERRQVLTAITGGQLLVQLSSLPVTLALPSMARSFGTDLETAAWIVILNLLVLGSTVLLGARLGDRFGHPKVCFIGAITEINPGRCQNRWSNCRLKDNPDLQKRRKSASRSHLPLSNLHPGCGL